MKVISKIVSTFDVEHHGSVMRIEIMQRPEKIEPESTEENSTQADNSVPKTQSPVFYASYYYRQECTNLKAPRPGGHSLIVPNGFYWARPWDLDKNAVCIRLKSKTLTEAEAEVIDHFSQDGLVEAAPE